MSATNYAHIVKEVGKVIQHRRLEKHWSYAEMAAIIKERGGKVSAKTIENIEKGAKDYQLKKLYWIAEALNLTLTDMLAYTVANEVNRAHTLVNRIIKRSKEHHDYLLKTLEFIDTK